MDTKEVKVALKAAREAIRNKDFKEALRFCKEVLKSDKNNYNAYVFVGVAAEGLEQPDQAIKSFHRATELAPDQLLPWQGLCSFYEKCQPDEYKQDLVTVYETLVTLYKSDQEKRVETSTKLANLYTTLADVDKAATTYHRLLRDVCDTGQQMEIWGKLVTLLGSHKQQLSTALENMLLEAYRELLKTRTSADKSGDVNTLIQSYLSLLIQREEFEEMLSESENLSQMYPDCSSPWHFLLLYHLDQQLVADSKTAEDVEKCYGKVPSTVDGNSAYMSLAQGFLLLTTSRDYSKARELLQSAVSTAPSVICGHVYLAEVLSRLHDHAGVSSACTYGLKMLERKDRLLTSSEETIVYRLKLILAGSYYQQGTETTLSLAVDILEKIISESAAIEGVILLAYVLLEQHKITEAEMLLDQHCANMESGEVEAVRGWISYKREDWYSALHSLTRAVELGADCSDHHLKLGQVHWQLRGDPNHDKATELCFAAFLKSAKLDPNNYAVFKQLGDFYSLVNKDMLKAKRCYQKAFDLNAGDDGTGAALCDTLVAMGEEERAYSILVTITSQSSAGRCKWAWLRLGLYQVKYDDPSTAITSFQSALRADPKDNHVWECLAEAYLHRGSHTAALKAFTKAAELDASSMYCLYQIAFIKQTLGVYTEAIADFKQILETSPNYVPALKGVGETLLLLARSHLRQNFSGRATENCAEALHQLTKAVSQRPDLSCLWKLLGDACTILQPLSDQDFRVSVPSKLMEKGIKDSDSKSALTKQQLLKLGARCYGQALKILPDSAAVWHDLGISYFYQSQQLSGDAAQTLIIQSEQMLQKAVTLDPQNFRHWTALGRLACSKELKKFSLAQHCFIKSILAEANNVVAWTNLGTLYLHHDNIKLAHEAFKVAQSLDPTYVACWIGQALIAESVGHEDAMDLFRHTTELAHHLEGALGYAHWVCTTLSDHKRRRTASYKYCIEQMAAVPAASDALVRYLDRVKTNPSAYSMYGLLLERQGLIQPACDAFKRAVLIMESDRSQGDQLRQSRCNYARLLCKSGCPAEAISQYDQAGDLDTFEEVCGLGLAHYKAGQISQSFQAYEKAVTLACTEEDQSHVYAALGMVAYKLGNLEGAKTALFKCSQTSPSSNHGLVALCSLGFIQSDATLVMAVIQELLTNHVSDFIVQATLLSAALHILQGDLQMAHHEAAKAVHLRPHNAALWHLQSTLLLQLCPEKGEQAAICAKACHLIDQSCAKQSLYKQTLGELAGGLHTKSAHVGGTIVGKSSLLRSAQRGFHLFPDHREGLVTLLTALHAEAVIEQNIQRKNSLLEIQLRLINFIRQGELKVEAELYMWLVKTEIVTCILMGRLDQAKNLLQQCKIAKDNGHLLALLKMLTGVTPGDITPLHKALTSSQVSTYIWQLLAECALHEDLLAEVDAIYRDCLQFAESSSTSVRQTKFIPLIRLAHLAFQQLMTEAETKVKWQLVFEEASVEVLRIEPGCSAVLIMQGLLHLHDNPRLSKRHFKQVLDSAKDGSVRLGFDVSLARRYVIQILKDTKKDPQAILDLLKEGKEAGDVALLDWYKTTFPDITDHWENEDN